MYAYIAHLDEHYDQTAHVPVHALSRISVTFACNYGWDPNMHIWKQPHVSKNSEYTIPSTAICTFIF